MKITYLCLALGTLCHSYVLSAYDPGTFQQIIGSPFAAGNSPGTSAYSPLVSGNLFAAVPNYDANNISVYQVNQTTGYFTQVPGSPFATGSLPAWQVFSPLASGNLFSAVVNYNDNTVSVYSVNQTTGVFTEIVGSPFATGNGPYSIEYSPIISGNLFAAVANSYDNTVSVYKVNHNTGVFTEVVGSPFTTGSGPYVASFSPNIGGNLYSAVSNFNDNTVTVYSVNKTTGAFTEVFGSPFATGTNPNTVVFSPDVSGNLFAAVANLNSNNVSVFEVNVATGTFTEVASSPYGAGIGPNEIAFSPHISGHLFAAVVNFNSNNISVYDVNNSTGEFTEVTGSPFASGSGPDGITFSPHVSGNLFAATANFFENTSSVYQVTIESTTPMVNHISPFHGPLAGGTSVMMTGKNFTGATTINFGAAPATSFRVISDTEIDAVSPPGSGTVDITITSPQGTSAIDAADKFTYR